MYSTAEVARKVGVNKRTLLRWLYAGEVAEPQQRLTVGKVDSRLWTECELQRLRAYKEANYRKRS